MAITRRLVNQTDEDTQYLRIDHPNRFIMNDKKDWQFLFGPNSSFGSSAQVLKIAAQLDTETLSDIKFIAYLYNPVTGNVDKAASCVFNVYRVLPTAGWFDNLITTFSGVIQSNSYFFAEKTITDLSPSDLDGDNSIMIEVVATRLSNTYRDRVYINHLGIYDSVVRLRNEVEFLDLTKQDE